MAAPKYLRNTNNGRVLPWSPTWAARKDMVPCDAHGNRAGLDGEAPPTEPTHPPGQEPVNGPAGQGDGNQGGSGDPNPGDSPSFDPETIIPAEGASAVRIDDADTASLGAFAERHFGEKIAKQTKPANAAKRVRELIAENGHPDEPDEDA